MIHFHLANSPITWKHKHVKGHQDTNTPYSGLDVISQANIDIDGLVKEEWKWLRYVNDTQVLPGQCWRIKNNDNGEYIQGDIESSLRSVM